MGSPSRRWLVPEVIQTSAMDCGPASLKALLEGHHVPVSYGRLREACQTDVDGTSIDTLEEVANQLGLACEQVMVPVDHVLLAESDVLPALIVIRHPDGQTHFVVLWRHDHGLVQIMDPGMGRRWMLASRFLHDLYVHAMPVPAEDWRGWVDSDSFLEPLRVRLRRLGLPRAAIEARITAARDIPGWEGLAELDATTRMVQALIDADGLTAGAQAEVLHASLLAQVRGTAQQDVGPVPRIYWSAFWAPGLPEGMIYLRGAVLLRVSGVTTRTVQEQEAAGLSPDLMAALREKPVAASRIYLDHLRQEGTSVPALLAAAIGVSALGAAVEALLFRGLMDLAGLLALPTQRVGASLLLVLFLVGMLLMELPFQLGVLRAGRRLEGRLRAAFLEKIPRLGDRYFQSRPSSDMAERSHAAHFLRQMPGLVAGVLRSLCSLMIITLGLIWLDPAGAPLAVIAALCSVALPLALWPILAERDLRFRTHGGSLTRFYLDAMLGLMAVRTHGAERSVRRHHEDLLTQWSGAGRDMVGLSVALEGLQALVGFGMAALLLGTSLHRNGLGGSVLLYAWWALSLPTLGAAVAMAVRQYPGVRNMTLRLLEPLGAPEEGEAAVDVAGTQVHEPRGMAISLRGAQVRAAGHTILDGLDLEIGAGEHVAIVGASGAGKSSLVGLLLGWHRASAGEVCVDGAPLHGERLAWLRRRTAWVDPAVQLWNQPFLDNLIYGADGLGGISMADALQTADLREVLERLPEGLQTSLGEGGALLSGGQGQRVRLGRALLRAGVRLVLLDEPFRGLDRDRRRALLARARARWPEATVIVVTHDVGDTVGFGRVLVVDAGRVVEDAPPEVLAARPDSRFSALLRAEEEVRQGLWGMAGWRRLRMVQGHLHEGEGA